MYEVIKIINHCMISIAARRISTTILNLQIGTIITVLMLILIITTRLSKSAKAAEFTSAAVANNFKNLQKGHQSKSTITSTAK